MGGQNFKAVWDEAVKLIHDDYASAGKESEFQLWFKMEYVEDSITDVKVAVQSEFMWTMINNMGFISKIQDKFQLLIGQPVTVSYVIKNITVPQFNQNESNSSINKVQNDTSVPETVTTTVPSNNSVPQSVSYSEPYSYGYSSEPEKPARKTHPGLNEDYTFEKFVTGENSNFAYSASLAVSKNPGKAYNPLLIYGGVGLGKTHLMQSIGNYIYSQKGSSVKIGYVTAENFTNEFTQAIRNGSLEKFKAKYRNLDVFLLDDIHFLINKEQTQEELFHTFEALYALKSQMVFTCDRPVTELKGISDRLKSRFSRGMSIDLQPPRYETRYAILEKKLEIMGKEIPAEVIDFIAQNVQSNVRDLEASLTKMIGYSELLQKPLTIEIARQELRDTFSQPVAGSISIEVIQKVVADYYGVSLSDIKSKKRNNKVVTPRQIAVYIARELCGYSYPQLGDEFGGRDHTTIMHSYNLIADKLKTDSNLDSLIQTLTRNIKEYRK